MVVAIVQQLVINFPKRQILYIAACARDNRGQNSAQMVLLGLEEVLEGCIPRRMHHNYTWGGLGSVSRVQK